MHKYVCERIRKWPDTRTFTVRNQTRHCLVFMLASCKPRRRALCYYSAFPGCDYAFGAILQWHGFSLMPHLMRCYSYPLARIKKTPDWAFLCPCEVRTCGSLGESARMGKRPTSAHQYDVSTSGSFPRCIPSDNRMLTVDQTMAAQKRNKNVQGVGHGCCSAGDRPNRKVELGPAASAASHA